MSIPEKLKLYDAGPNESQAGSRDHAQRKAARLALAIVHLLLVRVIELVQQVWRCG